MELMVEVVAEEVEVAEQGQSQLVSASTQPPSPARKQHLVLTLFLLLLLVLIMQMTAMMTVTVLMFLVITVTTFNLCSSSSSSSRSGNKPTTRSLLTRKCHFSYFIPQKHSWLLALVVVPKQRMSGLPTSVPLWTATPRCLTCCQVLRLLRRLRIRWRQRGRLT
jgi:hypothetical protein